MTVRRVLRHARALSAAEWQTLAAACALHLVLRRLVAAWPLDRVSTLTACRRAHHSRRLDARRLRQLVGWSTRLCHGTCLTESFVLRALSARAGVDLPVVVGVDRHDGGFHAHAWAGETGGGPFLPLWRSPGARSKPR